MKLTVFLITFITLTTSASAQLRLGVRAGLAFNNLIYIQTQDPDLKNNSSDIDMIQWNAAAVANYRFNTFLSLQTECIYTILGGKFTRHTYHTNMFGDVYTDYHNVKIRLQYFESPLLVKYTIFGNNKANFDIMAGAFAGYKLSAKQKTDAESFHDKSRDYTSWNAGITLSLGLSIMQQRMFFEMRVNRGLVDIDKSNEKVNTAEAMYTVGYYLFRGKKK